ncbi:methyltransferase domain-containing protein [Mycolicibacterium sp. S2-37]|uniref:class I SAM-dependent methyltransferase n=1 Tax=Mycolicibacterium sp. S2-37 TaxID=2810297 RepID=UPI001A947D8C|nr:methyltransferase domain-containing protein [Mycolicibacterium sp. S2-37]MBO0679009.1 methyltransferase domain-containing protein [Mycolicibacterium sp. S2-37]
MAWEQRILAEGGAGDRLNHWLAKRPALRSSIRSGMQVANAPFAKARMKREIERAAKPYRLEIGGHKPRDGWLVTNVNATTRLHLDATKRWPFDDHSVEYIFSDNVIEHLTLQAGRKMLEEAHRCMQTGGTIRIVTPDLRAHIDMYLGGGSALDTAVSNHYKAIGLDVEHPIDLVRIPIASFGHHEGYLYDFETLRAELHRAGFGHVNRCELGKSAHSALAGIDVRETAAEAQLAVEATA